MIDLLSNNIQFIRENVVLLTAFFSLGTAYFMFRNNIRKTTPECTKSTLSTLTHHSVFTTFEYIRNIMLERFELEDKIKEAIFRDIVINMIDIWGSKLYELAEKVDDICNKNLNCKYCATNHSTLIELNETLFQECCLEYETYYKNRNLSEEEIEMIHYSMEIFIEYFSINLIFIKRSIQSLVRNTRYISCTKMLQSSLFIAYESSFNNVLSELESSIEDINGYYANKSFKPIKYRKDHKYLRKK